MSAIFLSSPSKKKLDSVVELAKKLGVEVTLLTKSDIEEIADLKMLKRIEEGKQSGLANREEMLAKLGIK